MKKFNTLAVFFVLMMMSGPLFPQSLSEIELPPGFTIEYYTNNVPGARSLALDENGTVYVSTRDEGNIYALPDENQDGEVDSVITLATELSIPNGIDIHEGDLYVAERRRVLRYPDITERLETPPDYQVVLRGMPGDSGHGWRYMKIGPDNRIYIGIGAPCNVCLRSNEMFATISRAALDGSGFEVFASGIRNTVGFDWHPETSELWFTDNGRDHLGDNRPPDELNHAPEGGMFFGFPYIHGRDIQDPEFYSRRPDDFSYTPPETELGPHVASLGMRFYTGDMFPSRYENMIFIAEHGSWDRSTPIGYRITMVDPSQPADTYSIFAEGWLRENGNDWGRPVDVLVMPDGALLVSDDKAGAVYRISYIGLEE
ncbi:MAG: PQQ-dependent sugar dehydrogenase [Spirochaetia bacterium]